MASSTPNKVFCAIRKEWVAALPEEIVRQRLIQHLIQNLQFPAGHLVLEKSLRQMPHLSLIDQNVPDRRADLVCFARGIDLQHDLYPLLLVECKSIPLTPAVTSQVAGYNHFVKSHFICVANQTEMRTGWYSVEEKKYVFVDFIPSYQDLMSAARGRSGWTGRARRSE